MATKAPNGRNVKSPTAKRGSADTTDAHERRKDYLNEAEVDKLLEGGKRISYGARAITEGGWQSVPKLTFPGGALIGCAAGLINLPRIKGSHNAMLSGMQAAEHVAAALGEGRIGEELTGYEDAWRSSDIGRDLKKVRNVKPFWSKLGTTL